MCLPEAFGFESGDKLDICVPSTNVATNLTACGAGSTCLNGEPGCAVAVTLGTSTWTLSPATSTGDVGVKVDSSVTQVSGTITTTGNPACALSLGVKSNARTFTAQGIVAPEPASAWELGLNFQSSTTPTITATAQSATMACLVLAANLDAMASDILEDAMVSALNERAKQLSCMACRTGACQQGIACVDR
jgi:hypothetical protein